MTINTMQKQLSEKLAKQELEKFLQTEVYQDIMAADFPIQDKKNCIVLEVNDKIQEILIEQELIKLFNLGKKGLLTRIGQLMIDVNNYESELYKLRRAGDEQPIDGDIMNAYYGVLPSEKLNLFEAIEQAIKEKGIFLY